MQIRVEKFLAITAMLASAAALSVGCVTEDESGGSGGTGGSGGSSASGGSGGSAGSTGGSAGSTGGTAGSTGGTAGSTGGTGGDAAAECLGDALSDPDAGVEGFNPCPNLPYYATVCGDAGLEGPAPLGARLCDYMVANGRAGVVEELASCLAAISGDACSTAHDDGVQICIDTVFLQACTTGPIPTADGGTYDLCKDVAESCPADDAGQGGISEGQCLSAVSPFTADGQLEIANCYNIPVSDCVTDFTNCVYKF